MACRWSQLTVQSGYWANSMATDDHELVHRTVLVQGTLTATITLLFTFILENQRLNLVKVAYL